MSKFTSYDIMYFEYLDGGYEGTIERAIPNDLDSNLDFIDAVAASDASGIFLDEVSDGIYTDVDYDYLEAIHEKAVSLVLLVVFNTGVRNWDPALEVYCDYIMGTESWDNTDTLTPSESNCTIPIWTLTQKVNARKYSLPEVLTLGAWDKGLYAHYACVKYTMLPDWLEEYTDALRGL